MKAEFKRKVTSVLLITMLISTITGCGKQSANTQTVIGTADDTETVEVNQNDFRGGIKRIEAIRGNVLNIVNEFNQRNFEIQDELPCSYWNSEEYQYFVTHCINGDIYQYTDLFNEFETDWATVEDAVAGMLANSDGKTPQDYALTRVTDNHYTLTFQQQDVMTDWRTRAGNVLWTWDCIYNPTHDWLQEVQYAVSKSGSDKTAYQNAFLEYGRRDNVFVMQTETERLYVVYENVEPMTVENTSMYIVNEKGKEIAVSQDDIDNGTVSLDDVQYHTNTIVTYNPLRDNKIKAFYYSRLDGNILPQYIHEDDENALEEADGLGTRGIKDDSINYELTTDEGYVITHYNTCDSIFTHIGDISSNWVTEMGTYAQVITYENGNLTVKTANQLSHLYEIFKFFADGKVANSTEPIEPVKVQVIPSVSDNDTSEDIPTYGLYDIKSANCKVFDKPSINGVKTELPLQISDFKELGFELDTEDLKFVDTDDLAYIVFRADSTAKLPEVEEGEEQPVPDYLYVGVFEDGISEMDESDIKCFVIDEGSIQNGLSVSVGNIAIGANIEDIQNSFGNGERLRDGYGYFDGNVYIYLQTSLMKDADDNTYWGISSIAYFEKSYVDGLLSGIVSAEDTASDEPYADFDEDTVDVNAEDVSEETVED